MMKKIMKVTTHRLPLNVRSGPALSFSIVGSLAKGSEVTCTEQENGWYKHSGGWSSGEYLTLVRDESSNAGNDSKPTPPPNGSNGGGGVDNVNNGENEFTYDFTDDEIQNIFNKPHSDPTDPFNDMKYVLGMPYKFLDSVDIRPENCGYGREYLRNMINDGSFLFVTPGAPEFFLGAKNKSKIISGMTSIAEEGVKNIVAGTLNGTEGRYYTMAPAYQAYSDYVRAMCRVSAVYIGLKGKKPMNCDTSYEKLDWDINRSGEYFVNDSSKENPMFKDIVRAKGVCFYIDGKQTSYSESMSNATDSSLLEGFVNKASEGVKEARFIMGGLMNDSDESIMKTSQANFESQVNTIMSKFSFSQSGMGKMWNMMKDSGHTLVNGGNIILPDVWRDSAYNKSYNIEVKLASPYGDIESIYLHVLVPLFHLIALCYPKQLGRSGYAAPFLVRAFCKGWFNCDMGIIESMNIKKGSQDGWSVDGLPTEIDVSFSLKDLYSTVTIGKASDYSHLKNSEFLDMIGTLSGININSVDILRKIDFIKMYASNKVTDTFENMYRTVEENIIHKINSLLK